MEISPGDVLPSDWSFYSYRGSLTSPGCNEIVEWIALKCPIKVSSAVNFDFVFQNLFDNINVNKIVILINLIVQVTCPLFSFSMMASRSLVYQWVHGISHYFQNQKRERISSVFKRTCNFFIPRLSTP